MKTLDWYFDFISPFSYLQNAVLPRIAERATIRRRPIFFAGLLDHWGQLGPAEIDPKRDWTFRHCVWLAERAGIPFALPTMHPFNPLPLLRLSIALDDRAEVVDRLFRFVWIDGHVPTDGDAWHALLDEMDVDPSRLAGDPVKAALKANGADALAAGVFGVPTAVVAGEGGGLGFWGYEATAMLEAYLADDPIFTGGAMEAVRSMTVGPMRPQARRTA